MSSRAVRQPRSSPPWLGAMIAFGVLLGLALPGASNAAARPGGCPRAAERTLVTWGALVGPDGSIGSARAGSPRDHLATGYAPDPALLHGLARSARGPLMVRVIRGADGVGVPLLCDGRRAVARLPRLHRGENVAAASVNGRRIVWRTWRRGIRGKMRVGRIGGGRVRVERQAAAPVLGSAAAEDPAVVVLPDGTAAWALLHGARIRTWVWRPGHRLAALGDVGEANVEGESGAGVRFVDRRNLLVTGPSGGDLVVAFRPPVPGRCPVPLAGRFTPFAGWLALRISGGESDDGTTFASSSYELTCDPGTGRYVDVSADGASGSWVGDPGTGVGAGRRVRVGDRLVTELRGSGEATGSATVTIRDVVTGTRSEASGELQIVGAPGSGAATDATTSVAAVAAPGTLAWCAGTVGRGSIEVWLADAGGARVVGRGEAAGGCGLRLDGALLTWRASSTPGVTVVPAVGTPFGVR